GFGAAGGAPSAAAPLVLGRIRRAHPGCGLVLPEGRIRALVPPLPCGVDGFQYGAREGEGRHRPWVLFGQRDAHPSPIFGYFCISPAHAMSTSRLTPSFSARSRLIRWEERLQ